MNFSALPMIMFESLVKTALLEDLARAGDLTTDAIIPPDHHVTTILAARQSGIVAGLDMAKIVFQLVDSGIEIVIERSDGSNVSAGQVIAFVSGPARGILTAERTALNFLCHLSGIATATASMVAAVHGYRARIVCTRKTTPGLRALEKYAVRVGGGSNHRFGLDDAILIKDNHIAIAGGIRPAIERARASMGHLVKIEVEIDTLAQLEEALSLNPDAILFDNMPIEELRQAVVRVGGHAITETSGCITPTTVRAIAATNVDLISIGWLTHSAPALDIGLDYYESSLSGLPKYDTSGASISSEH